MRTKMSFYNCCVSYSTSHQILVYLTNSALSHSPATSILCEYLAGCVRQSFAVGTDLCYAANESCHSERTRGVPA